MMTTPRVLTVANQKGGVGKTTVLFHLAHLALEQGQRVLLVDLDSQGNATAALSADPTLLTARGGAELLFSDEPIEPIYLTPASPNLTMEAKKVLREAPGSLSLLHGHVHLDAVDTVFDLDRAIGIWRRRLRELPYDLVLIDTPPSQGVKPVAALLWSDQVVIPTILDDWSLSGVALTQSVITQAQNVNTPLTHKVLVNRFRNLKLERDLLSYQRETFPLLQLEEPFLPERVAVKLAVIAGVPIWRLKAREADEALGALWRAKMEALLS